MARRTQVHTVIPWIGGINTSVDAGVLNQQELVQADNVAFSSTGARIKREALEYLDPAVPNPNRKSSSTYTRTLKWTTTPLVNITSLNERLVVGERITVSGDASYLVTDVPVNTVTAIQQITTVVCVADSSGSLAGTYFLISAGDQQTGYYVWYKVSGSGSDPAVAGLTGILVNIVTNDTASAVATATQTVLDAETDFSASVVTDTVTVTCAVGGVTSDGAAGTSGFTVTVTTQGGHSITYTSQSTFSEAETSTSAITIERASGIIMIKDYWRWNGTSNSQLLVYATDDFQLFKLDSSRRIQIHGQEQITSIICGDAASLSTGDYFLLSAGNDETDYYVWINKDAGGGDPAVAGRTGVQVVVTTGDTAPQVATAVKNAIDALADFSATVATSTVTVTNAEPGITAATVDVSTGFTITTTSYGATAPLTAVSTINTLVFNEDLIMVFSGTNNKPIMYNPDDSAKYQLLALSAPDASLIWSHQGRVWMNDKTDRDFVNFSPTFDHLTWGGIDDSGGFPVKPGDGDPEGIINAYSYKGFMVIAKKAVRYRMIGESPEEYLVELISEGLGNEGALAIPVDESDVVFMSRRGIHSQAATDRYGDTDAAYLSAKIKPTFNTWAPSRLRYAQGTYIPELNSIALGIAEQGNASQQAVWLYNIELDVPEVGRGAWYRWPDISCQALSRRFIEGKYKLVFGTTAGRLIQAQVSNDYTDFGTTGIEFKIKSGIIYPGGNPQTMKAFKRITMFYRPKGNFSFTVKAYIDSFPAQAFGFNQISGLDLLGSTFILGESILGTSQGFAPFTFTMDGVGRGVSLEIMQPTADEQIEVWGFAIEYEDIDLEQEVKS